MIIMNENKSIKRKNLYKVVRMHNTTKSRWFSIL